MPHGSHIERFAPGDPLADVAGRALASRLGNVVHALPLAARHANEDPEYVHELRVASRRALAAMEIFAELLPPRRARRLRKVLQRIRRAAGKARDTDVLLARWQGEADVPPSIRRRIQRYRRKAQKPLLAMHERLLRKGRLSRSISKLLVSITTRARETPAGRVPRFDDWAADILAGRVDAFFAASRTLSESEAALHRFRISGKGLRYTMEVLTSVLPAALSGDLYPMIVLAHAKTGKITDHAAACRRLRKRMVRTSSRRKSAAIERLLRTEETRRDEAARAFADWWTPVRSEELHRRFLTLLTRPA